MRECNYCGNKGYFPFYGWTFKVGDMSQSWCSDECKARDRYEADP